MYISKSSSVLLSNVSTKKSTFLNKEDFIMIFKIHPVVSKYVGPKKCAPPNVCILVKGKAPGEVLMSIQYKRKVVMLGKVVSNTGVNM